MKRHLIKVNIVHRAKTTPEEVEKLYIDYGHSWVFNKGLFVSRQYDTSNYEILAPNQHFITIRMVFLGIFRQTFHQKVTIEHGRRITNEGKNIFGYPIESIWVLEEKSDGTTEVHATYQTEVPKPLAFLIDPVFRWFCKGLREKSWKSSDRVMLERRNQLLGMGFNDSGVFPDNHWKSKAEPSTLLKGV